MDDIREHKEITFLKNEIKTLKAKISELEDELFASKQKIYSLEQEISQNLVLENANILIADGNLINQKIFILSMQKSVKSISVAHNGQDAIDKFLSGKFDIIIMDVQTPVIDGVQTAVKIREIEAEQGIDRTPIIAITANASDADREHCLALGIDDYMSAPFQVQTLFGNIKKLLKSSNKKKKIVVFTGAGISKESGIDTFRDKGGVWEQFDFMEVSHIYAWNKNPAKVLSFFNMRRSELKDAQPNDAHCILAELERDFDITVITQNVDNLHERGGSSKIIHLHGEMTKARSSVNPDLIVDIGYNEIKLGEKAADGSQLRPHVVMFGEPVPLLQTAVDTVKTADIFVIIGTSLNVNPAASLIGYVKDGAPVYLIDPDDVVCYSDKKIIKIQEKATVGTKILKEMLNDLKS